MNLAPQRTATHTRHKTTQQRASSLIATLSLPPPLPTLQRLVWVDPEGSPSLCLVGRGLRRSGRGAVPTSFKSLVSFEDLSCLYMISGSGERKEKTKKQIERERERKRERGNAI